MNSKSGGHSKSGGRLKSKWLFKIDFYLRCLQSNFRTLFKPLIKLLNLYCPENLKSIKTVMGIKAAFRPARILLNDQSSCVAVGSHFKIRRIDKAKVENGQEGASTMTGERR